MSGAFICGCLGPQLSPNEVAFLRDARPWGLILFKRNIDTPEQVRALVGSFRDAVGTNSPVLIDQEGGRVQRLGPPWWRAYPPAARLGGFYSVDKVGALAAARQLARLIAEDLFELGIDINCMPVLDVPQPGSHRIIGDRAYSEDPEAVALLAGAAMTGLLDGGVLPVVKHIPGHGRALSDSHEELPVLNASAEALRSVDLMPFAALAGAPIAMTAHIVCQSLDPANPVTLSSGALEMIRRDLGFDGLIMTDDLSMRALTGTLAERSHRALDAGCDMLLHCNGDMAEMNEVAAAAGLLADQALARAEFALSCRREPRPYDRSQALATLARLSDAVA